MPSVITRGVPWRLLGGGDADILIEEYQPVIYVPALQVPTVEQPQEFPRFPFYSFRSLVGLVRLRDVAICGAVVGGAAALYYYYSK